MKSAYNRAKSVIDQTVKDWNKTTLTDIEKWHVEWWKVNGMIHMALVFLNFEDYNRLKQYVYDEYGFNVGGIQKEAL